MLTTQKATRMADGLFAMELPASFAARLSTGTGACAHWRVCCDNSCADLAVSTEAVHHAVR